MNTSASPSGLAGPGPETARILVVDDESGVLELLTNFLRDMGYSVESAGDGTEALALLDQAPFDVVLSDIRMPNLDGVQLLKEVRRRDLDLPVILMTGAPSLDTAIEAVRLGANHYLTKPMSLVQVRSAIEEAVCLRRMARLRREALEYLSSVGRPVSDRAGLEIVFDSALDKLWMAYQPIFKAPSLTLYAREALVRTDETRMRSPAELLEAAERLDRLPDLGRRIRAKVAELMDRRPDFDRVYVNLHPKDLLDEDLFSEAAPLTRHSRRVVLEMTERAALDDVKDAPRSIIRLRELGYKIALDDLGAGYAGLNSFAALKPDVVKLDMCLVRDVDTDVTRQRLVRSMTQLCHDLKAMVVAEGIETAAELAKVIELGADLLQGYHLGRPERV